jgi:hypothetical protein
MDALYRASGDPPPGGESLPPRVVLSAKARRQRDKDSMRRARRKAYPEGLSSVMLDKWWFEVTRAPLLRQPAAAAAGTSAAGDGAAGDGAAMSGEQAFAFFSRSGLPNGA